MEKDFYKNINREMFNDNPNNLYIPQLEDEVYFIFQGYEELVAHHPYHFITLEEERNKPITDYLSLLENHPLSSKSPLTHHPLKCKVTQISHHLPSATTFEIPHHLSLPSTNFSIQTELELSHSSLKFSILYFPHPLSPFYLLPSLRIPPSLPSPQDHIHPSISDHPPKEVIEVCPFEPELFPSSSYKCIAYREQVFSEGHRLRRKVGGRSRVYTTGRMWAWAIQRDSEWREIQEEEQKEGLGEVERAKLVEMIDGFIRNNTYTECFLDVVTDDVASDYLNLIAVEMNLYTIREFLERGHYRSKQMLFYDLGLIEKNSITFNGEDNEITKDAKKTHENLRKMFEKVLVHRLRNVPQRSVNTRNRESANMSDNSLSQAPKKATPPKPKRSTRKRNEVNYNEDSKLNQLFKKPTPQKMKRQEDLSPEPEGVNFKIDLEPERVLRRSSRTRNQVGYNEFEEAKTPERRITRGSKKRETKQQRKSEFGQKKPNTRRNESNDGSDFSPFAEDDEDEDY